MLLREHTNGITRTRIQHAIREGAVSVNGGIVNAPSAEVLPSDCVSAILQEDSEHSAIPRQPSEVTAKIVYADEHLLVVDKPSGLAVHPGQGRQSGTLVDQLKAQYPQLADLEPSERPGIVHRIDMDTSGLLVVGLTRDATDALANSIRERRVSRLYLALVDGVPERSVATIDGPIGRDQSNPTRQSIDPYGRPARTRYAVMQSYRTHGNTVSLLHVKLETGRMHQIRVHLQGIGHPVIGDHTYRGPGTVMGLSRQFLHACQLEFPHPISGQTMSFESNLPGELQEFLNGFTPLSSADH